MHQPSILWAARWKYNKSHMTNTAARPFEQDNNRMSLLPQSLGTTPEWRAQAISEILDLKIVNLIENL